jgi:hypothetical protein
MRNRTRAGRRLSAFMLLVGTTVAISATSAHAQGLTCMPKPSACGFPDATNTGVAPGTALTPVNGTVTLSAPGAVLENKLVTGSITVTAPNVTIRNVKLVATDPAYGIRSFGWQNNTSGLRIENVEIDLAGNEDTKGIAFDNYSATRVWFHNGLDCAHVGDNVTITDSFCDLPPLRPGSSAHADGFQSDGGANQVFRHNTIRNPSGQTSAILMSTNTAPIGNVVIDNNLMSGGGYTVYCGTDEGGVASNTTYTNNVISREFFAKGGRWGPTTWCDRVVTSQGNIWDGNVRPAGANGSPGAAPPAAGTGRLSRRQAKQLSRAALRRELGHRFARRARGLTLRCDRRSAVAVACKVAWRRKSADGAVRRYRGKVTVRLVEGGKRRYSLRIRGWSGGCRCARTIKHTGTL